MLEKQRDPGTQDSDLSAMLEQLVLELSDLFPEDTTDKDLNDRKDPE